MKFIKYFILVFVLIIGLFFIYITTPYSGETKLIYIKNGSGFIKVASVLKDNNIIKYKYPFIITAKIISHGYILHAGEFEISSGSTIKEIINKIITNDVYYRSITFAEGLTTNTIVKILNNNKNLIGELDPKDFEEGIFLPETYKYTKGDSKISILNRMRSAMIEFLNQNWSDNFFEDKYKVLILASIVEKETSLDNERKLISSVYLNRLQKGMRLQADPTVVYSFTRGDTDLERPIKKSDLIKESEYNTYKIKGLPPTPICNPGKESIMAVLHPIKTDYIYFVAINNSSKGHNFSTNYQDHLKFVKMFRSNNK